MPIDIPSPPAGRGTPPGTGARTRERIVAAAGRVMHEMGLARATTKEIAKAAGCSEATLYKYFPSKEELFLAVLGAQLPSFGALLTELLDDPGGRTTEQALTEVAREAARFYEAFMPIGASLFAEPALLRRQQAYLRDRGIGPYQPLLAVARFLAAEAGRGRIRRDADVDAAAGLLLGACFQRAFLRRVMGDGDPLPSIALAPTTEEFAASIAATVMRGLA
jgi:AcrR family transcriptional regulator